MIRALAAGGAKDVNGLSNVIYAGTSGTGPLSSGLPTGGHVWVSTNIMSGPSTWMGQTGSINPGHFPISSIAIDSSDISGLTAYVGIMGFGVSHVWKTITGGVSWNDFTGSAGNALPDSPVNALVVDTASGTIYAATDVGVFASGTGGAAWGEVGPSPGGNNPGFLPNVAVTALGIFDPRGSRRLRASTYGRGLWELSGFNLGRPVPEAISVAVPATSGPVVLKLTSTTLNGAVNLSCAGLPSGAVCNFSPGSSVPLSPGNPVTVTLTITTALATPSGVFSVAIHAGSPGYTTQTQNLLVTVTGGFSFSIANTSGVQTVIAGQAATYNLNVVPSSGSFPNPVTLFVTGCPQAAACSVHPAQIATGSGGTAIVVTIATSSGTILGTYSSITVSGTSGSASASVLLSLIVQGGAFSFSMSNSGPATIAAGSSAKYDIAITPSTATFPNPVALSFTACSVAITCSLSSVQVPAGSGKADVSLTVTTTGATPTGVYTITVTGASGALTANTTISLTVTAQAAGFSFTMSSSGPATIAKGSSGKYDVTVTPSFGTFPNPVALTFTACPSVITCSLSSSQVAAGSGTTDVFLTVATQARALHADHRQLRTWFYALVLPLPGLMILFGGIGSAPSLRTLRGLLLALVLFLFSGCGGLQGGSAAPAVNPGTPLGNYTVTVIGTSGSLTANTTISLTVN